MKQPLNHPARFLTSLGGEVALRLAWLAYLGATAAACILGFYGMVFMRADFFAGALALGGIAWLVRLGLGDRLADLAAEMDGFDGEIEDGADDNGAGCGERTGGLVALLKEWDAMERQRGAAKFDPWALQSLRGEIRQSVQNDPELERLFCPRE